MINIIHFLGRTREVIAKHPAITLYFLFFFGHLYLSLSTRIPLVYNDEAGYIGKARMFVDGYIETTIGIHINVSYYPDYSLLLIPVFWISNEIEKRSCQ